MAAEVSRNRLRSCVVSLQNWRTHLSKANYNDQTNAANPQGGKHHETRKEGKKLPTDRPYEQKYHDAKKSVDPSNVAKTTR